ncbi:MBL fold metallo-hydrolase [Phnomibacter sp. MR]|uniref:MBL fold metallo-hydrolase n=1 Tax=Phnomibacter sp. MR TaxID=3042318 RepID=UPI003A80D4D5
MLHIAKFTFSPIQENTYVLYTPDGLAAIIDPGCYFDHEKTTLANFIAEKTLKVQFLLQTHCHLDHVFGLQWAAETYQLQPHMHPIEEQVLQYAPMSGQRWNLPFTCYSGPIHYLNDNDTLQLGNNTLQAIFAPGHSPGHLCYYCAEQNFIIAGDVLFERSIGRTDLPGGDHDTLLNSIRTRLFTLPESTMVHPGHGDATKIGLEKRHNPFLQ